MALAVVRDSHGTNGVTLNGSNGDARRNNGQVITDRNPIPVNATDRLGSHPVLHSDRHFKKKTREIDVCYAQRAGTSISEEQMWSELKSFERGSDVPTVPLPDVNFAKAVAKMTSDEVAAHARSEDDGVQQKSERPITYKSIDYAISKAHKSLHRLESMKPLEIGVLSEILNLLELARDFSIPEFYKTAYSLVQGATRILRTVEQQRNVKPSSINSEQVASEIRRLLDLLPTLRHISNTNSTNFSNFLDSAIRCNEKGEHDEAHIYAIRAFLIVEPDPSFVADALAHARQELFKLSVLGLIDTQTIDRFMIGMLKWKGTPDTVWAQSLSILQFADDTISNFKQSHLVEFPEHKARRAERLRAAHHEKMSDPKALARMAEAEVNPDRREYLESRLTELESYRLNRLSRLRNNDLLSYIGPMDKKAGRARRASFRSTVAQSETNKIKSEVIRLANQVIKKSREIEKLLQKVSPGHLTNPKVKEFLTATDVLSKTIKGSKTMTDLETILEGIYVIRSLFEVSLANVTFKTPDLQDWTAIWNLRDLKSLLTARSWSKIREKHNSLFKRVSSLNYTTSESIETPVQKTTPVVATRQNPERARLVLKDYKTPRVKSTRSYSDVRQAKLEQRLNNSLSVEPEQEAEIRRTRNRHHRRIRSNPQRITRIKPNEQPELLLRSSPYARMVPNDLNLGNAFSGSSYIPRRS